jgi:lysophospholipase L1-like esterase
VTFGFGVPEVFEKRPHESHPDWLAYPARMEKILRAANPGRAIEVAPMAVPGYSTHQGLAWMRRDLSRLHPDLVTLLFGWNDIGLRAQPDAVAMRTDALSVTQRRLLSHSQALLHSFQALHAEGARVAGGSGALVPRVDRDAFVANFRAMVAYVRECGAAVAVIGPVYRDRVEYPPEGDWIAERRAALRTVMEGLGVPYVEVPELTEASWPANRGLFLEHIHPNHKGHRLLAERLIAFLADHRLLGDLATLPVQP